MGGNCGQVVIKGATLSLIQSEVFMARNRLNGLYLTIANANMDPNARVIVWHRTGDANQQWYIDSETDKFRSNLNDFCLDVDYYNNFLLSLFSGLPLSDRECYFCLPTSRSSKYTVA